MNKCKRLPAEWEAQSAVMLTWPHEHTDWRDLLQEVEQVYFKLLETLLHFQPVLLVVPDRASQRRILEHIGRQPFTPYFYFADSNDTWARDHGPIVIECDGQHEVLDFNFNAWGNKFAWQLDNAINHKLFTAGAFGDANYRQVDFILEGGAIESDGQGTLLTTRQCLLSATRNGSYSQAEITQHLQQTLGIKRILWLEHGYLEGDDTDSHIDTLARFCDASSICYVQCTDPNDVHFNALQHMEQELLQLRQTNGQAYRLYPLPMADAVFYEGERLPATYANFLIINGAVLVPIYHVASDQAALATLQACFPEHQIIPIDCRALIKQHGSLHCITMQLPRGVIT